MKFGKKLQILQLKQFSGNYVSYKELKRILKEVKTPCSEEITPALVARVTAAFKEQLLSDLRRINDFHQKCKSELLQYLSNIKEEIREGCQSVDTIRFSILGLFCGFHRLLSYSDTNKNSFHKALDKYDKHLLGSECQCSLRTEFMVYLDEHAKFYSPDEMTLLEEEITELYISQFSCEQEKQVRTELDNVAKSLHSSQALLNILCVDKRQEFSTEWLTSLVKELALALQTLDCRNSTTQCLLMQVHDLTYSPLFNDLFLSRSVGGMGVIRDGLAHLAGQWRCPDLKPLLAPHCTHPGSPCAHQPALRCPADGTPQPPPCVPCLQVTVEQALPCMQGPHEKLGRAAGKPRGSGEEATLAHAACSVGAGVGMPATSPTGGAGGATVPAPLAPGSDGASNVAWYLLGALSHVVLALACRPREHVCLDCAWSAGVEFLCWPCDDVAAVAAELLWRLVVVFCDIVDVRCSQGRQSMLRLIWNVEAAVEARGCLRADAHWRKWMETLVTSLKAGMVDELAAPPEAGQQLTLPPSTRSVLNCAAKYHLPLPGACPILP
mmetsp:Transcript_9531/g.23868  ORF Transcript_9531/g.23868 Transcript_9531/m.23868 type:complete len:552 (-) Transcript_9531:108-1763(-)|eukprot:CAMPEP_0177641788 /NCGR_PEP_ID=MMETSP0447-20121125/7247_1 /TAXON_ID=0 /ORGANISM="Stygamoeba regulata, Strain BSH-02190019" /LENGTH=551 /DNA_ID=CAMNT_0019143917 /DNA_START=59 /DNA_END=1714 /DNA_ORIENTATION=+